MPGKNRNKSDKIYTRLHFNTDVDSKNSLLVLDFVEQFESEKIMPPKNEGSEPPETETLNF